MIATMLLVRQIALMVIALSVVGCRKPDSKASSQGKAPTPAAPSQALPWHVFASAHYRVESLVDSSRSQVLLTRLEMLYTAYGAAFGLTVPRHAPLMELRLYRDRHEMHAVEAMPDWAEGIYRDGLCIQYLRRGEANPWHWAIHEAAHQLNAERAGIELPRWLEEGLACLFSCSRLDSAGLHLGTVDPDSYPAWWLKDYRPTGHRALDLKNGKLQSLETIVRGGGVVPEDGDLNLAYLSWWTVTRFLWSRDPQAFLAWVKLDRTPEGLERIVGPLKDLEEPYAKSLVGLTDSVTALR